MPRRGKLWFVLQLIWFIGIVAAPLIKRRRLPVVVRLLGLGLFTGGAGVAVAGYSQLGDSHSPWTTPSENSRLVTTGIYGLIRNPIYGGWCLGSLGLELTAGSWLGVGVVGALTVFYDLKARQEEKFLTDRYVNDYREYRDQVKRFIPGVY